MQVMKFGGSSLATIEQIKKRAQQIAEVHRAGESVIVVVSAMGRTTNELVQLASQVSSKPHRRELDMLLTTGERVSMALMSMALHDLGCPAISFTGSQAGIMTEDSHNDASIKELKPIRVEEEINKGNVVVIAGFQGVNPNTKEITTLGRGGSDTTAIAFAHHFQAKKCQVFKDVPGVLSADPKLVNQPRVLEQLSFRQLKDMCVSGAQVLHSKAIALALELQVPFEIVLADPPHQGTKVGNFATSESSPLSINLISQVYPLPLNEKGQQNLREQLIQQQMTLPKIINESNDSCLVFGDAEVLQPFVGWAKSKSSISENLSLLSLTFAKEFSQSQLEELSQFLKVPTDSWLTPFGPCCLSRLEKPDEAKIQLQRIHDWIRSTKV